MMISWSTITAARETLALMSFFEQSLLKSVYTHSLPHQTVSIRLDITTAGKAKPPLALLEH